MRISGGTSPSDNPTTHSRVTTKRVIQAVVSLAVVIGIFVGVMPRIANYSDVWDTITAMTGLELAILLLIGLSPGTRALRPNRNQG